MNYNFKLTGKKEKVKQNNVIYQKSSNPNLARNENPHRQRQEVHQERARFCLQKSTKHYKKKTNTDCVF